MFCILFENQSVIHWLMVNKEVILLKGTKKKKTVLSGKKNDFFYFRFDKLDVIYFAL